MIDHFQRNLNINNSVTVKESKSFITLNSIWVNETLQSRLAGVVGVALFVVWVAYYGEGIGGEVDSVYGESCGLRRFSLFKTQSV